VSRLSRQCGIPNISQPYRPPRPVTGIALLYLLLYFHYRHTLQESATAGNLYVKTSLNKQTATDTKIGVCVGTVSHGIKKINFSSIKQWPEQRTGVSAFPPDTAVLHVIIITLHSDSIPGLNVTRESPAHKLGLALANTQESTEMQNTLAFQTLEL
jgi:hypothetical protein